MLALTRCLLTLAATLGLSACGGAGATGVSAAVGPSAANLAPSGGSQSTHGKFLVVAAENFWGSLAAQLAGDRAVVRSIVVNPATDPHAYSPIASDGALLAQAQLAVVNGLGYDTWASQTLAANPSGGRIVLNVGDALGLRAGDNPHRWYVPADVRRVIDRITADYARLDPADAAYFAHRKQTLERQGLARYDALRAEIRRRYAGVPVGYSESIFQDLGQDLGLRLLTPYRFTKAIAEGTEVTAVDRETVDRQAQSRQIKVWVYNSQNASPDVQRVNALVRAARIPIVAVTETLSPAADTFEQWQVGELERLLVALRQATGR